VTRLTKSAPEISEPSLPKLPPVTSEIFVEILVRALLDIWIAFISTKRFAAISSADSLTDTVSVSMTYSMPVIVRYWVFNTFIDVLMLKERASSLATLFIAIVVSSSVRTLLSRPDSIFIIRMAILPA